MEATFIHPKPDQRLSCLVLTRSFTDESVAMAILLAPSLGFNPNYRHCVAPNRISKGGFLQLQARRLPSERVETGNYAVKVRRVCVVASGGAGELPLEGSAERDDGSEPSTTGSPPPQEQQEQLRRSLTSWWKNWQTNASEMRAQVAKLGLAAVLAYGLFDGVTYTSFFVLAFLGYEKSTGQNPAANLKALLGVVVLMWTGNNVTRPLRVAGAAALAPLIDRFLKKTQQVLKLPNQAFAFMLVVASFASLCFSVVGLLILSRWGK